MVLPDCQPASAVARRLLPRACHHLTHASGRPWLIGCWPAGDDMRVTTRGNDRFAVSGPCASDPYAADSCASDPYTADLPGLDPRCGPERLLSGVAGSFHVLASLDGRVYARGDRAGARRLYLARAGGVTVLADRAHVLAWLTGAAVERAHLAARLLGAALPHPLGDAPMWQGIHLVPPGQAVLLDRHGGHRLQTAAGPTGAGTLPLEEGAAGLREALLRAVAARIRPGQVWGADLSGGMDSTSLCFLAVRAGARVVAATLHWSGADNQDIRYAALAAGHLPGLTHLTFPAGRLPAMWSGLAERRDPGDEPGPALRDLAHQDHISGELARHGATRRLSGHGGDHLVVAPAGYLTALARRRPLLALRHAAAHRAGRRWSLPGTARMLLPAPGYPAWLRSLADQLRATPHAGTPHAAASDAGTSDTAASHTAVLHAAALQDGAVRPVPSPWGPSPYLPSWCHPATDLVADLLLTTASRAEPLADEPGAHAWRHQARQAARSAACIRHTYALDSPFCDDEVLDACLAVRAHEAGAAWSYKPLLAAAMRGLVPEEILRRTTKDSCELDWYAGMRAQQRELAAWAGDSHLVAAGLADPGALRRTLLSPGLARAGCDVVEATLGAEAWLRDLAAHPVPACLHQHPKGKERRDAPDAATHPTDAAAPAP